ncbi:MAG: carbohydrate binding family 9 domain-containing protein [Acidobacteria bacterium]|nr:carbohydrate binding family 9 domain-containing protein [Acidobacteriota bacterium]
MNRLIAILLLFIAAVSVFAADAPVKMTIRRAAGPITIDGDLSDAGWQNAMKSETWYETNPGDNIEPKVKTIGYIAYDDHFFYAAIHSFDKPSDIRAQLGDHDGISGNSDDFSGVILDTRNDGKSAMEFFVNAAGTQYDATTDDFSGEDSSPDLFWDSAVKRTADGWVMELRIPFSSLRYQQKSPQVWGIILYRNMPRERRYQVFDAKLPRGTNCFVCNFNKVGGFEGLPTGGHIVVAPYVTASENGTLRGNGNNNLLNRPAKGDGGLDVKYTPNEHTALDATLNPDFSQIESDVAQISTNQRFAIFFPEKRPFFLERVELFSTPIQAVYTRTITSPRWGIRGSGNSSGDSYTMLVAQDRGGGSVIIPSATGSSFANQDFGATDAIGRWRHDFGGTSFASFLFTDREYEGGGHNRVLGPDFQWKPTEKDTFTGQFLVSQSRTPNRPDLAGEWDGRNLSSYGSDLWWSHSNPKLDLYAEVKDFGDDFRADQGFVPQVGYRSTYGEGGWTMRPKGFFSRIRYFGMAEYDSEQNGNMLYRLRSAGFGADGKFRSFTRLRFANESFRNNDEVLSRNQLVYTVQFAVSRLIPQVSFDGWVGQDIDFFNNRVGRGARVNFSTNLRPTTRLTMSTTTVLQWLSEHGAAAGVEGRLFTAQVERVRAQYMFTPRMFVRAVVQNQRTSSNPLIYGVDLPLRDGNLSSQLLFAYKVNWQSVLYVGYGDIRDVNEDVQADPANPSNRIYRRNFLLSNRQLFFKLSYAFQK